MQQIPDDVKQRFEAASARFNDALAALPIDKRAHVEQLIEAAEQQTLIGLGSPEATLLPGVGTHAELALAAAARDGRSLEDLLGAGGDAAAALAIRPIIDRDGGVLGFERFEMLDPGWLESVAVWMEHHDDKFAPFPADPAHVVIPDETTIAVVGDWGTGAYGDRPSPSLQVAEAIAALAPDYTIHLGDVYYSGTVGEETDRFLRHWPAGSRGSFALNSNHEMFSGGHAYYDTLLADGAFGAQNGTGYFALENADWVIVGLDASYDASWWEMYGPGNLDDQRQLPFLRAHAEAAHEAGKQLLVMTHQNGLSLDGGTLNELGDQVLAAAPEDSVVHWYWGHLHNAAIYVEQHIELPTGAGARRLVGRCCGHGAIPWGPTRALESNPNVAWFERTPNPEADYLTMNGFALLTLRGAELREEFRDQTGNSVAVA